jgi:hypothetical protein
MNVLNQRTLRLTRVTFLGLIVTFAVTASASLGFAVPVMQETASPSNASPSPTPNATLEALDNRLKELEKRALIATKEKEIAESQAALATAEKNKITNMLPSPTATPLAGSTTVNGTVTFQGDLLAYKSLDDIARNVAQDLHTVTGTLIIHNADDIAALQSYDVIHSQIKALVEQYKSLNAQLGTGGSEEAAAALFSAPQVVSTLLRSVADVAALFRTDTTITGLQITPDETVFNAALAARVGNGNLRVFEPKLYLPNLFDQQESEIIKQLGNLNRVKARGEQLVADFDALSDAEKKGFAKKSQIERLRAMKPQVDVFISSLMQFNETTKQSPLMGLYRAEKLKGLLTNEAQRTYILHLKIAKSEGARTTKSNLFTGSKTSYTGGMIVAYTLFDRNGQIVSSGLHASLRGAANNKVRDDMLLQLR